VAFPDAHRYQEYRRVRGSKERATVNVLNPRYVGASETAALDTNKQYLGEDSGADPEDNDNGNDDALLLSVREIVDHSRSRRDTARVDHEGLARNTQ
jgi:hypothetical protein